MLGSSLPQIMVGSALGLTLLMTAAWAWSVKRKDAGVVDVFWGISFILVAAVSVVLGDAQGPRSLLLPLLVGIWGLRLSGYLAWRNLVAHLHPGGDMGELEDRRYRAMRTQHGKSFWWVSYFRVFALQAALVWFISLPIQLMHAIPGRTDLFWMDYLGLALFALGLFFEAVGDWQLGTFRLNPGSHGEVLKTGLWRYTRHPNYFGDFMVWWGLFVVAAASGAPVTYAVLSPLLMTLLLLKVSGVALTERNIVGRRPRYREYIETTSAFFPLPPRKAPQQSGQGRQVDMHGATGVS